MLVLHCVPRDQLETQVHQVNSLLLDLALARFGNVVLQKLHELGHLRGRRVGFDAG